MIKALIFDCFGVLYWDDINRLYELVPPSLYQDVTDVIHAYDHGFIDKEEFITGLANIANVSPDEVRTISREKYSRNEPLISRARELKADYKTALLSNMGRDMLLDVFSEDEQKELFDAVVVSGEVGLIKPSKDLFEYTLERLGVQSEEAVFIDDRPANIDGADKVGIHTILFSSTKAFEQELKRILEKARA